MAVKTMQVKIILPHQIFWQQDEILRLVVETSNGSFGILPRRLDCILTLRPGLLVYETTSGEGCMALDSGFLLKRGAQVSIVVRRAVKDAAISDLHQAVSAEFLRISEHEGQVRSALERLESGFVRRLMELKKHG